MADEQEQAIPSLDGAVTAVVVEHGDHEHTIYVPEGCTDATVRYETPDGAKHEWVNPDAPPAPLTDPGPGDDVIYDAALGSYVPRISVNVSESGTTTETQTT